MFENSVYYLKSKCFTEFSKDEKAQMHTLEGVAAATIMLIVIVYAIDATSMTPLTSSTANVHAETELQALGQDILSALDDVEPGYTGNSQLKNDVLNWNGSEYIWNGTVFQALTINGTTNPLDKLNNNLTAILNATLVPQGIAHNVDIVFIDNSTLYPDTYKMIYNGNPSDNAVIVSRKIVLYNSDCSILNQNSPIFIYGNDIDPSTNLCNIVEVRLTLWRM